MKLGFIGTGNMAGAIMGGIIKKGLILPQEIIGADVSGAGREKVNEMYGICVTADNTEVIARAQTVILSVKPQFYQTVISQIKDLVREDQLIITIAPGKTLDWLRQQFGRNLKIIRTMPNTPAMVYAGAFALCNDSDLTEEEKQMAQQLFAPLGIVEWVPEHLIDAVCGVSGSGPAYVAMFMEAMADGGVREGLPRATAYQLAAQTVMGTAKWYLESGTHPGVMKDMVTSPAGTTIAGCAALEKNGLRNAVIEAVHAGTIRSKELGD